MSPTIALTSTNPVACEATTRRRAGACLRCVVRAWALLVAWVVFAGPVHAQGGDSRHDVATAIQSYTGRAAELRTTALARGSVAYLDVIEAAYGPGVITIEVLEAKARWRAGIPQAFTFVADYSAAVDGASVGQLAARADKHLDSTLVALYESITNQISISSAASDFALFHEAGHALQRVTLRAGGTAASRRPQSPEVLLASAGPRSADPTTMRRLEYLCTQIEFEVRLQDLNRFHALIGQGLPIMSTRESIRALAALGLPMAYEECRDALALGGQTLTTEEFAALMVAPAPETSGIGIAFEDARELKVLRRLTQRVAPDCWVALLAKIIFEAPGHL